MRTVNITELLDVLTCNKIDTSSLEKVLNSEAMPNAADLAGDILDNLYNYAHYSLNTNFKKNAANIKKYVDFIVACYKSKTDRNLVGIRSDYATFCNKLPAEYRELMGKDCIGPHAETIGKYVEGYIDSFESLKRKNANNPEAVKFINDAINLLNDIAAGSTELWDYSSAEAVHTLENVITTIQEVGKVAKNGFFASTKLNGLKAVKEELQKLNHDAYVKSYQVKPTNKYNKDLLVSGEVSDEFINVGAVSDRLSEYEYFKKLVRERNESPEFNEQIKQYQQEIEILEKRKMELAEKKVAGVIKPHMLGDWIKEVQECNEQIKMNQEIINEYREAMGVNNNSVILEFEKICVNIDVIKVKNFSALHSVINSIDFASWIPIVDGTAYEVDEATIQQIDYVKIATDEIKKGSKKALDSFLEHQKNLRKHLNPETVVTEPVKTPEQILQEQEAQAAELLKSMGIDVGVQQTPAAEQVETPKSTLTVDTSGLLGND